MAGQYKTPGVYVEEISVFPPSVAEVETAVPAFVGYTEKAARSAAGDLLLQPTKIYSLKEFEQLFGGAKNDQVAVTVTDGVVTAYTAPTVTHILYFAVKMFFDNGGGQAYIVSVGTYGGTAIGSTGTVAVGAAGATPSGLLGGLAALELEDEPTLLVIPEAVKLNRGDYQTLVQAMLTQCGKLGDRFAILDYLYGDKDLDLTFDHDADGQTAQISYLSDGRSLFGANNLKYGATYYPFVKSAINPAVDATETNVLVTVGANAAVALGTLAQSDTGSYNAVKAALKEKYLVLPPSGAVTGVYAATDNARGVWKAPANVSVADVIEPAVRINDEKQKNLNVDATSGKSINVLRAFAGKGTLVWGARTLAGNDNEWRYVPVRRFFNTVEESIKKSTAWAVFEPNDANTWVKVRGMIENYLTQKWREGALAGATTKEAFFVRCGLGTTMNSQDILEGRMIVEIGMAAVRPAEFIILRFSHKLQTS